MSLDRISGETGSDVIPVRLHFSDTLPRARQPISHRRVCLNNGLATVTHLKVSHDLLSMFLRVGVAKDLIGRPGKGFYPAISRACSVPLNANVKEKNIPVVVCGL